MERPSEVSKVDNVRRVARFVVVLAATAIVVPGSGGGRFYRDRWERQRSGATGPRLHVRGGCAENLPDAHPHFRSDEGGSAVGRADAPPFSGKPHDIRSACSDHQSVQ